MSNQSLFVVGSTCSGKSFWSLEIAEELKGCIVNCDSVQVYHGLRIGAAQPTAEDFKRVPHFLYDFVKPPEEMTAGQFRRKFFEQMDSAETKKFQNRLVVGGTGFYFQALEKGMFEIQPVDEKIKQEVLAFIESPGGQEKAYEELKNNDPEAAAKIHPSDAYRIGRALEILRSSGRKVSELQEEQRQKAPLYPEPLRKIGFYFEKDELTARVKQRTAEMLDKGLIEETESLVKMGFRDWLPLRSVGYKEALEHLEGHLGYEEMHEQIVIHTLQLAKRQKTWFKRDPNIHWFHGKSDRSSVMQLVRQRLNLA